MPDRVQEFFNEWEAPPRGRFPTIDDYTAAQRVLEASDAAVARAKETPVSPPVELHPEDPCPACGGELVAAPVPTDAQWAKASDRENPVALPRAMDSAPPSVRAELGELYRCGACGYAARFPHAA